MVRFFLRFVGSKLCKCTELELYMKGENVPLSLQEMMEIFMDYCVSKQLRPKTLAAYDQTMRLFIRWLTERYGVLSVEQLKEAHIRAYIQFSLFSIFTTCLFPDVSFQYIIHLKGCHIQDVSNMEPGEWLHDCVFPPLGNEFIFQKSEAFRGISTRFSRLS